MLKIFLFNIIFIFSFSIHAAGILPTGGFSQLNAIKVKQISTGQSFNCALLEDATVKCWGYNDNGQIGKPPVELSPGSNTWENTGDAPGEMEALAPLNFGGAKVVQLDSGQFSSCAIMQDGGAKCWGNNSVGQLGYENTVNYGVTAGDLLTLPNINLGTDSGRPYKVLQISQGSNHTCALLDNSRVKCWGYNNFGMLGLGDGNTYGHASGTMGDNLPFVNLGTDGSGNLLKAKQILAGHLFSCVLLMDSTVKCWGNNTSGQLGEGNSSTLPYRGDDPSEMGDNRPRIDLGTGVKVIQLATGGEFICALTDTSQIKCWGNNGNFQAKTAASGNNIGDTANEMGANLVALDVGTNARVIQIAAGSDHVCVLIVDGTVKCWGYNGGGQLGKGNTTIIGSSAAQMGTGLTAIDLGTNKKAVQISAKGWNSCAVLDDGSLKCWGQNNSGQLGIGTSVDMGAAANQMGDKLPVAKLGRRTSRLKRLSSLKSKLGEPIQRTNTIAVGSNFTCAILENSKVKCWGTNPSGQLGIGSTTSKGSTAASLGDALPEVDLGTNYKAIGITAGTTHVCALMSNNQIKCWGDNTSGQLGYGDTTVRGTTAATMGSNLLDVNVGTNRSVLQVSAGGDFTCVLLDDYSVKCWGTSGYGQLGMDSATTINSPPASSIALGEKVIKIASGHYHSCAILVSGKMKCWGRNDYGQLGQDNTSNYGYTVAGAFMANLNPINLGTGRTATNVSVSIQATCAVLDDMTAKCFGSNFDGALGQGITATKKGNVAGDMAALAAINLSTKRVKQTASSYFHNCVLTLEGEVKCFGNNSSGQLGLSSDVTPIGKVAGDMGAALASVNLGTGRFALAITAGIGHTCALLDNYTIRCWGGNSAGEIGVGTSDSNIGKAATPMSNYGSVHLGTGK